MEENTSAVKFSAPLTGRAIDVYTRKADDDNNYDDDANDYAKLKKALLTRYNFTEDGYRKDSWKPR